MSIFNRRRRLRQAVYASPQRPTTPLQIDIPDETLAEIAQEFENSPKNYNQFTSNNKPFTSYQSTKPSLQNRQQFSVPQKHPNNQLHGNENALPKKPKFEQDNRSGGNNENCFGQQQNKSMARTGSFTANTGNSFSNKLQNPTKKNFSFTEKNTMNKPQQSYLGQKSEYSWNSINYGTNSPAKATTAGGNARQPRDSDRASFGSAMMNQNKRNESPTVKNEVNPPAASGETGFSLQTVDKSMKFVTSTIQGVRKWSEYRDQIPLVFEIVVTLDSVPTSNNNGTAKLFNIKDNTGSSRCIYWEMDQKLPRMARGQIYRLVGALERKTGHFQCFTIRQAQANEQRLAKQEVEMCNDAMTKVISMISEA